MNRKLMVNYRKDGRNTRPRSQTLRITLAAGVALLLALAFGWFHFRSPFKDDFDEIICIITVVLAVPCFVGGIVGWLMWLDVRDRRRSNVEYRGCRHSRQEFDANSSLERIH